MNASRHVQHRRKTGRAPVIGIKFKETTIVTRDTGNMNHSSPGCHIP
jgi:hypothetical protein